MWNIMQTAAHAYRQYELMTGINMFEPWEKKLINGFFLIMLVLVVFSSYVYLPTYMETLLEVIKPTIPGSHGPDTASATASFMHHKISSI